MMNCISLGNKEYFIVIVIVIVNAENVFIWWRHHVYFCQSAKGDKFRNY